MFRIFCKNHVLLRENNTVKAIVGEEYHWHGSIVVMRAGKARKKWVINMWGHRDAILADYALDQLTYTHHAFQIHQECLTEKMILLPQAPSIPYALVDIPLCRGSEKEVAMCIQVEIALDSIGCIR
ncbi:hypothetical protein F5146DRAFT_1005360 [Armillaria mellea]|nr:hypothetical protein F5146DRAFT_1005360 [Armillaria mellea]